MTVMTRVTSNKIRLSPLPQSFGSLSVLYYSSCKLYHLYLIQHTFTCYWLCEVRVPYRLCVCVCVCVFSMWATLIRISCETIQCTSKGTGLSIWYIWFRILILVLPSVRNMILYKLFNRFKPQLIS